MEILGKERIASLSTHYTLCMYACLDLDATQVREKNRRVKKDGKGTRKGITYQQEFLAKKKRREQRNSVTTHRVYERENMGW